MITYCLIAKGQEIIAEGLEEEEIVQTTKLYNNKIQTALESAVGIYPNLGLKAWTTHDGIVLAKVIRDQISIPVRVLKSLGFHVVI